MDDLGLMVRVFLHRFRASPAFGTISHVPNIFTRPEVFVNKHSRRILPPTTYAGNRNSWLDQDSFTRWYPQHKSVFGWSRPTGGMIPRPANLTVHPFAIGVQ